MLIISSRSVRLPAHVIVARRVVLASLALLLVCALLGMMEAIMQEHEFATQQHQAVLLGSDPRTPMHTQRQGSMPTEVLTEDEDDSDYQTSNGYYHDFDFRYGNKGYLKDPTFQDYVGDPAFKAKQGIAQSDNMDEIARSNEIMHMATRATGPAQRAIKKHKKVKAARKQEEPADKETDDYEGAENEFEERHDGVYKDALDHEEYPESTENDSHGFFRATGMSHRDVKREVYEHPGDHDVVMTSTRKPILDSNNPAPKNSNPQLANKPVDFSKVVVAPFLTHSKKAIVAKPVKRAVRAPGQKLSLQGSSLPSASTHDKQMFKKTLNSLRQQHKPTAAIKWDAPGFSLTDPPGTKAAAAHKREGAPKKRNKHRKDPVPKAFEQKLASEMRAQ